jgi:3-phosphoinositide dependent protein kinase-1
MLKVHPDRGQTAAATSIPVAQSAGHSPTSPRSLVDLSRNASVISTSSSSSSSSIPTQLMRPLRPPRPFSAPRRSRSRDPHSPGTVTPRATSRPPAFLRKDLAMEDDELNGDTLSQKLIPPSSRRPSIARSRQNSIVGKSSANDFTFDTRNSLGEGSYSEVSC